MNLTTKQQEIIKVIGKGNEDGSIVDLDQLIERLSYKPSKESIHFSIRALIKHELIEKAGMEKRRGRSRSLIRLKPLGQHFAVHYFGTAIKPAFVEESSVIEISDVF